MLQQMATALEQLRAVLPPWLAAHLSVSLEALREAAVTWLRTHASQLQLWGGHTVRGLGYTLAGVVIGALAAMQLSVRPEAEGARAARSEPEARLRRSRRELHRSRVRAAAHRVDQWVAVGTRITPRPPHRSVRAALPHTAPALSHDAKRSLGYG